MSWFRKSPAPEPEPEMTPADDLAAAHAAMKQAQAACKRAKDELNAYESRSRTYGPKTLPDGTTCFQLDYDPRRLALSLQAARLNDDFQTKTKRWSELDRQLHPETVFVAGVRVSP
jgi:hypothetical protein